MEAIVSQGLLCRTAEVRSAQAAKVGSPPLASIDVNGPKQSLIWNTIKLRFIQF